LVNSVQQNIHEPGRRDARLNQLLPMWSELVSDWMFISTQFTLLSVQFLGIPVLLLSLLIDEFLAHLRAQRNRNGRRAFGAHAGRAARVVALPARG
jgi:hypothetical protein